MTKEDIIERLNELGNKDWLATIPVEHRIGYKAALFDVLCVVLRNANDNNANS